MKRAVLYARVSTDAQQKEGTIGSQVLELKRQIAAAGDVLVKVYLDDGYSGSLLDRPGLEELRRDVRTPLFDAVYFLDTDRIARDCTPTCRGSPARLLGTLDADLERLTRDKAELAAARRNTAEFPGRA
jgi:DNA invertase Pin-like site-specific DNA recombinase